MQKGINIRQWRSQGKKGVRIEKHDEKHLVDVGDVSHNRADADGSQALDPALLPPCGAGNERQLVIFGELPLHSETGTRLQCP